MRIVFCIDLLNDFKISPNSSNKIFNPCHFISGDSVAYFKKAYDLLISISNPSQNSCLFLTKDQIKDTTIFAHDVIKGKYDIAVRENEFIYHEKVPTELEELKGKILELFYGHVYQ